MTNAYDPKPKAPLIAALVTGALLIAAAVWVVTRPANEPPAPAPQTQTAANVPAPAPPPVETPAAPIAAPAWVLAQPVILPRFNTEDRLQAVSADGARVLVIRNALNRAKGSGVISSLFLIDAHSGVLLKTLVPPSDDNNRQLEHAVFSPDGKRAATGSWYGWTRLWDIDTGEEIATFRENFRIVEALAFSSDGTRLATAGATDQGSRHNIYLYDLAARSKLLTLGLHDDDIMQIVFTPDGKKILTASRDQTVRLWDALSGKELFQMEGHTGPVMAVAVSPDGKMAASVGQDGRVCWWNLDTGALVRRFRRAESPDGRRDLSAVAFSPDGQWLLAKAREFTEMWAADSGNLLASFDGTALFKSGQGFEFISAGQTWAVPQVLAPAIAKMADDPPLESHDIVMGPVMFIDNSFPDQVEAMVQLDHGRRVMAGFSETSRTLLVEWDTATGKELRRLKLHGQAQADGSRGVLAFSPDGKFAAVGGWNAKLFLVNTATGEDLREFVGVPSSVIYKAAFSPDGQYLVSADAPRQDDNSRAEITIWRTATGERVRTLQTRDLVWALVVSADGKYLVSGGGAHEQDAASRATMPRREMHLWDFATGQEIRQFTGLEGVAHGAAISADDRVLIAGPQQTAPIAWDLQSGKQIARLDPQLNRDGNTQTQALALSPDGTRALTGGADRDLRYYDLTTGKLLARLEGHKKAITTVAFTEDLHHAITGSADGTVRLWQLP